MNTIIKYNALIIIVCTILASCSSGTLGKKVREPFQGNAFESNARFYRGVGKGISSKDNIAKSKADLEAKRELASQVNTNMKTVTDQYLGQTENERAADVAEKFQSLTREVMNTEISDLRKIGEEKFFGDGKYTVFMAYEIKKNAMLRNLKKRAQVDEKINEATRKSIEEIIDEELEKLEED